MTLNGGIIMKDFEKVLQENTVDGVIDFVKVEAIVNEEINNIVAKKTDSEKVHNEAVASVIEKLGIENATDLAGVKLYIKQMGGNSDEIKEANLKLESDLEKVTKLYDDEVAIRETVEKETTHTKQMLAINELGITGKQAEFLHWDLSKEVTDKTSFNDILGEYSKANKHKTTNRFVKDDFGPGGDTDNIYEAWRGKRETK